MSFQNANQAIQRFVNEYGNTDRTYEFIEYIQRTSFANTSVELDNSSFLVEPGKKREVKLNYFPIQCDVEGECNTGLCDAGEVVEPKQIWFDVQECTATKKYALNFDDVRLVDWSDWDFNGTLRQIWMSIMPEARKLLATDMATKFVTLAGKYVNGRDNGNIAPVNVGTGVINPIGFSRVRKDFMDSGFSMPYIVGGDDVYYYKENVNNGGLNQDGQRIDRSYMDNMWYDDQIVQDIKGDNENGGHVYATAPEVFKYISYSANAGIFRTDVASLDNADELFRGRYGEGFMLGTVLDPVTGVLWDLYINFEKCNATTGLPQWTFQLKHNWDFFIMPDVACNVQGVNGIYYYRTCPPVEQPCPEGSPEVSPATESTFAWTPGSIYNIYINKIILGGQTWYPETLVTDINELAAVLNDNPLDTTFAVNGSDIEYDGFAAYTGTINDGQVAISFS